MLVHLPWCDWWSTTVSDWSSHSTASLIESVADSEVIIFKSVQVSEIPSVLSPETVDLGGSDDTDNGVTGCFWSLNWPSTDLDSLGFECKLHKII